LNSQLAKNVPKFGGPSTAAFPAPFKERSLLRLRHDLEGLDLGRQIVREIGAFEK
jgi:hypothetical protein